MKTVRRCTEAWLAAGKSRQAAFHHPEGGLFVFLTLPEHIDTVALYDSALSAGVAYVSGAFFHPDGGGRNTMRLNYSFMDMERIEEGISVLAGIIRAHINAAR